MSESGVAIVTAAGRGIGAACARELAGRGYSVSLMARSSEVLEVARELGGHGYIGDVTRLQDLTNLVQETLATHGRIDAVVNNTGAAVAGELLSLTDADWHAGFNLLFLNVVRMARLVTPVMERQGGGAIVNISAFGAVEPHLAFPISSAVRAALTNFTKLYADRYASAGLRMNNILPGFIDSYPVSQEMLETIPMKRAGSVSEIARSAAFLLSSDAAYITGQNIRVDGAFTHST